MGTRAVWFVRWAASWALYWCGCVCSVVMYWPGCGFMYRVYSRVMLLSCDVQGDGSCGPWMDGRNKHDEEV